MNQMLDLIDNWTPLDPGIIAARKTMNKKLVILMLLISKRAATVLTIISSDDQLQCSFLNFALCDSSEKIIGKPNAQVFCYLLI